MVYYLQELDGDDDIFSITTVNGKGIIRLIGQLDYERKFLYQLRVMAVDRANNERVSNTVFTSGCWNCFVLKFMLKFVSDFLEMQSLIYSKLNEQSRYFGASASSVTDTLHVK